MHACAELCLSMDLFSELPGCDDFGAASQPPFLFVGKCSLSSHLRGIILKQSLRLNSISCFFSLRAIIVQMLFTFSIDVLKQCHFVVYPDFTLPIRVPRAPQCWELTLLLAYPMGFPAPKSVVIHTVPIKTMNRVCQMQVLSSPVSLRTASKTILSAPFVGYLELPRSRFMNYLTHGPNLMSLFVFVNKTYFIYTVSLIQSPVTQGSVCTELNTCYRGHMTYRW